MSARGSVYSWCGCRDPATGGRLGSRCPRRGQRGHGSWYFSLELPAGLDGRRRRIRRGGFPTRKAAEKALARMRIPADPAALVTTGEWLDRWLAERTGPRESTIRGYAAHVRLYLKPCLGHILLADLTAAHVQAMFTAISRQHEAAGHPVTAATLARVRATLRAALNAAIRAGLVTVNVNQPSDIRWLLSRVMSGRILITSRLADGWHPIASAILSLDVLADKEAAELLTRIASAPDSDGQPARDLDGADLLCEELGNLPLAIEQAAAYIRRTPITLRRYLERLASSPAETYGLAAEHSDAARTIARIWRVSLDQLADTPFARQLLCILAWYAVDEFPVGLLQTLPEPARVEDALGRLAAYHLITLSADGTAVTVHRLVQAVARTADPADPHRQPEDITIAREVAT